MLSVQEENYVKSLINTYKKQGYKYYLVTTNSDINNDVDIYLYLSKDDIKAIDDTTFSITNGIKINIDTSYRYNNQPNILTLVTTIPGNVFLIDKYEYTFTNCIFDYGITQGIYYPDLLLSNSNSYDGLSCMYITNFLLVSIFLYIFIKSVLRIRR